MGTMKRVLLTLAGLALLALVVGASTPWGRATATAIAPFAKNADRIDGIHAARTPTAGKLLPLGVDGKFPASVLSVQVGPAGPKGDTGATGPQGAKGDPGTARGYGTVLATAGHQPTLHVSNLTAVERGGTGVYWLFGPKTINPYGPYPVVSGLAVEGSRVGVAVFGGLVEHAGQLGWVVRTFALDGGHLVASDDVSFTIVVP